MPRTRKRCPDCGNGRLQVNYYRGEEVDVCSDCGGTWFEKASLDRVIADADPHTDTVDYTANLGEKRGPGKRQCPDCARPLKIFHLLPDFHLDIHVCRRCDGAWIQRDAVCKVARSAKIKRALERFNGSVNWKTWVFQFLFQLPVEYNMKARTRPWVTWSLIALNTVIFLLYAFDPGTARAVIGQFAIAPADIQAGDKLWTLVTAMFLHGGFTHLIANMYFLWLVGENLEDALGKARFLLLYLAFGIGAALVSVLANLDSTVPSVGASGAIAGLFGAYALWFPNASLTFMFFVYQKKLAVYWYFALWLGLNFLGMALGGQGIDYWAHVGGFAIGIAAGLALRQQVWNANPLLSHLAGPEVRVRR